jgi:hypothetical protein
VPILSDDIKLLASERMTDNTDGGGRITGNEIVDGASNNLFPDISDLDRVYGRVALRKAFVGVQTDDTDVYFGAHLIVQDPPDDPNVGVTMFTIGGTTAPADQRTDARNKVESYLIKGPVSRMRLLEDQLEGQRTVRVYQAVDAPLPEVGEVIVLSTEVGGSSGQEQFLRITDVEATVSTFEDTKGTFERAVLTLGVGSALRYRFYGHAAARESGAQPNTRVRETTVADTSKYYGTRPAAVAAELGDRSVQVSTIFAPLVPSAQGESPVVDARAAGDLGMVIAAGPERTITVTDYTGTGWNGPLYLSGPCVPGSVSVTRDGGGWTLTDDGRGNLLNAGVIAGTVDYANGVLTPSSMLSHNSILATYTPGASVSGITHTGGIAVTLATRGYNYTATLSPIPQPGQLFIDFRSQGRWYRIRDNGSGELSGDVSGIGVGTVNYTTGSVIVTLGALPDVDSGVMFQWGAGIDYSIDTGEIGIDYALLHTLPSAAEPGSVSVAWNDGTARSATADSSGNFSGHATGRILHATGEIRLKPTTLPAPGTTFTFTYDELAGSSALIANANTLTFSLPTPVTPGSVLLRVPATGVEYQFSNPALVALSDPADVSAVLEIRDDGAGNFIGDCLAGGTINYATGACTVQPYKEVGARPVVVEA